MNDNILCLYYSRTGNTKKAMEEVAEALDCECLEIRDKVDRSERRFAPEVRASALGLQARYSRHARVGGPLLERDPRFFEAPRL